MDCPHCAETGAQQRAKKTKLGYITFSCPGCQCTFDELRQYFRPGHRERETMLLAQQRQLFCERLAALQQLMGAVS